MEVVVGGRTFISRPGLLEGILSAAAGRGTPYERGSLCGQRKLRRLSVGQRQDWLGLRRRVVIVAINCWLIKAQLVTVGNDNLDKVLNDQLTATRTTGHVGRAGDAVRMNQTRKESVCLCVCYLHRQCFGFFLSMLII